MEKYNITKFYILIGIYERAKPFYMASKKIRFAIFFPSLASVTMATVTASNQFKWVFLLLYLLSVSINEIKRN